MSDSSSEEDLSRFQEAVDTSFIKFVNTTTLNSSTRVKITDPNLQSERYLEDAGHYNDVKVSKELQKRIGAKVSDIINRNLKFVKVLAPDLKTQIIEGGVKLFKDSEGLLSCQSVNETSTEEHNKLAKNIKKSRRLVDEEPGLDQEAKIKSAAVSGKHVLSREDVKHWKSRRKEKIFKYKKDKHRSNVLIAID